MTQMEPIIAVKNVEASSKWYQSLLGCKSMHGGSEFEILANENDEVLLCLHQWGEHEHPTMKDSNISIGNGLLLYFRTENMEAIWKNAEKIDAIIEEEIRLNPNTRQKEFSIRDLDGYYLTISKFHQFNG